MSYKECCISVINQSFRKGLISRHYKSNSWALRPDCPCLESVTGIKRSMSDLPVEILVRIFSFYVSSEGHHKLMKNINNVCIKWGEVRKTPYLWKSVDYHLTGIKLAELSKAGFLRSTTKLNLSKKIRSIDNHEQLFQIIENCDNLYSLDMSGRTVTQQIASCIAQKCKKLKSLKLNEITFPAPSYFHIKHDLEEAIRSFEPFIEVFGRNLLYLSISTFPTYLSSICNNVLSFLPNRCHYLDELHISCDSQGLPMNVSEFQEGCPRLRVLEISDCDFICSCLNATNGFPCLEVFISNRCKKLGDEELYQLLHKSNFLHTLGLNGSRVTCEGLLKIPAENIERLYVSKTGVIPSGNFNKVISRWKSSLIELDLSLMDDKNLIDMALPSLWENNCHSLLEKLHLKGSKVSIWTLHDLFYQCKHLHYLDVDSCLALPEKLQKRYSHRERFGNLTYYLKVGYYLIEISSPNQKCLQH